MTDTWSKVAKSEVLSTYSNILAHPLFFDSLPSKFNSSRPLDRCYYSMPALSVCCRSRLLSKVVLLHYKQYSGFFLPVSGMSQNENKFYATVL